MKVTGIIAEYNPFHNGHLYQLNLAKKITGADFVIAVMSGDFVQRGTPAIFDKYTRTRMALEAGFDLVLELPVMFATSSAEDFAACGIHILNRLGIVDHICFGSEVGQIAPLMEIAQFLIHEPKEYKTILKKQLSSGFTFPKARNQALLSCPDFNPDYNDILSTPNNILGIEYCKALIRLNSPLQPLTVKRCGHAYHDESLSDSFASASAIRRTLAGTEGYASIAGQVPAHVLDLLRQGTPLFPDDLSRLLNFVLLSKSEEGSDLTAYLDLSKDLADRLKKTILDFSSFTKRVEQLKTRGYTYTRISRALLHLILEIRQADFLFYKNHNYCPYSRILGFRRDSAQLLSQIKEHGQIPLITKVANADRLLDSNGYALFKKDLYASHLYQSILADKYGIAPQNEYTRSVIIC